MDDVVFDDTAACSLGCNGAAAVAAAGGRVTCALEHPSGVHLHLGGSALRYMILGAQSWNDLSLHVSHALPSGAVFKVWNRPR